MTYKEITIEHVRGKLVDATTTAGACVTSSLSTSTELITEPNSKKVLPNTLTGDTKVPLLAAGHLFQLVALLSLEEIKHISLTDDEISVCAGPYCATTEQQEAFDSLCSKMAITRETIQCGERGRVHPCTAFHGMIIGCTSKMSDNTLSYKKLESPIQKAIIDSLLRMSRKLRTDIQIATDQCGLPSMALPLKDVATLYSNISTGGQVPARYKDGAARLVYSIKRKPLMFAPQSTIEGAIFKLSEGDVILRTSENGLAAATIISKSSGLAVKCNNGCQKTAALVILALLIDLGYVINKRKAEEMLQTMSVLRSDSGQEIGSLKITIR